MTLTTILLVIATFCVAQDSLATHPNSEFPEDYVSPDTILTLQSEIKRLEQQRDFFKEYYMKELRKSVLADNNYLDGAFADLDDNRVREIEDRYIPCADESEFALLIEKIHSVRNNKRAYESAKLMMGPDGPDYTPELVNVAISDTLAQMIEPLSDGQLHEVEDLKDIARLYPDAINYFKNRINDLRPLLDRESAATAPGYAETIRTVDLPPYLDSNQVKREYRFIISRVPKIKAVYDEWESHLLKNILSPSAVQIEEYILNLPAE